MQKIKKLSYLFHATTMLKTREGTIMTMEGVCPFLFLMMVSFFLSFLPQSSLFSDNGKGGCYNNIVMKEKEKKWKQKRKRG